MAWQSGALGNLRLSLPHFTHYSQKSRQPRPQSSWFFSWLPAFNENPVLLSEINTIHRTSIASIPVQHSNTLLAKSTCTLYMYMSVARGWLCAARGLSWSSLLIGLEKNMNSSLSLRQAALKFFKLSRASPLIWGFFVN